MNNTVEKLSDLAWSKLESLSKIREFIHNELSHMQSFPAGSTHLNFQQALLNIDRFTSDFSEFLAYKRSWSHQAERVEKRFEEFSGRYSELMRELEFDFGS